MNENAKYYFMEYLDTHQVYLNRKLTTIEHFIDEIPMIDECIGFQVWLDNQIANVMNAKIDKFREILATTPNAIKQSMIGFQLYRRNHQYLYSAYELAYAGLCEPCYNILRTTHESILALWYIATHPDESTDVIEYMYDNKRPGTQYSHGHFLTHLYTGEMEQSMKKIFSGLSGKAHSNIFGMQNTEQYSLDQIKDCFWSIQIQSFYNLVSTIETLAQNEDLRPIVLGRNVLNFVERLKNHIGRQDKTIADYFPNKENWTERFYLYHPH